MNEQYEKKELRQHIYDTPDTYVGGIDKISEVLPIKDNDKIVFKEIEYIPALLNIFNEILVNARDQIVRLKGISDNDKIIQVSNIKINFNDDNSITILNDGNGIVVTNKQATAAFNSNHTHLTTLGHYLPGMLYLPSEFYWSTDRLNYLEERLSNKNTNNVDNGFKKWRNQYNMNCKKDIIYTHIYTNLSPLISGHAMVSDNSTNVRNVLEMWYSPRSPYSQLAIARFYAIARYYQVPCVVNVVLPVGFITVP